LYAIYARGREARLTAAIVGESGLDDSDRRALRFADRFESTFIGQAGQRRPLAATLAAGWQLLADFPRDELGRISDATLAAARPATRTAPPEQPP
jgi:V/A-type H+-transporting ATPase subunit B